MVGNDFLSAKLRKQVGLEYEDLLVWTKKVEKVAEKHVVCKSRTRKPAGKHVVGYTTLMRDSPNNGKAGCFNRRIFIGDASGLAPGKIFPGVPLDRCREPSDVVPSILGAEQLISRNTAEKGLVNLQKINSSLTSPFNGV